MSPRKIDMHAKTRNKRRPPRGMYLNQDSLTSFVSSTQLGQSESILKKLETELVELKRQVCVCIIMTISWNLEQIANLSTFNVCIFNYTRPFTHAMLTHTCYASTAQVVAYSYICALLLGFSLHQNLLHSFLRVLEHVYCAWWVKTQTLFR